MKLEFENEEDFKKWIIERDNTREMINSYRLMLNIWKGER